MAEYREEREYLGRFDLAEQLARLTHTLHSGAPGSEVDVAGIERAFERMANSTETADYQRIVAIQGMTAPRLLYSGAQADVFPADMLRRFHPESAEGNLTVVDGAMLPVRLNKMQIGLLEEAQSGEQGVIQCADLFDLERLYATAVAHGDEIPRDVEVLFANGNGFDLSGKGEFGLLKVDTAGRPSIRVVQAPDENNECYLFHRVRIPMGNS